jgi:hypothetical protein
MTDTELARQIGRALIMYLGDCQETETEPTLDGIDGFAGYLVTSFEMGVDLDVELHREAEQIRDLFETE